MRIHEILEAKQLNEAVFDLDEVVDYIYELYFSRFVSQIAKGKLPKVNTARLNSEELPYDKYLDRANDINPVHITINISDGNSYVPTDGIINLTINQGAYEFVKQQGSLETAVETIRKARGDALATSLSREFTPERIKGSIHHELSHWLDDTFHNRHIHFRLKRAAREPSNRSNAIINQGHQDVGMTSFERDAQIHNIIQLKREHAKVWDQLTFDQLIELNPSLKVVSDKAREQGWYPKWKRKMLSRLNRENLLGKNMGRS